MRSASCWKNPRERCFPEWRGDFSTASALARALASRFTLVRRKRGSSSPVDSNCENELLAGPGRRSLNESLCAGCGDKRSAHVFTTGSTLSSNTEQDQRDDADLRRQDAERLESECEGNERAGHRDALGRQGWRDGESWRRPRRVAHGKGIRQLPTHLHHATHRRAALGPTAGGFDLFHS